MSNRNDRVGLTALRRPLTAQAPAVVSMEQAEKALLQSTPNAADPLEELGQGTILAQIPPAVRSAVQPAIPLPPAPPVPSKLLATPKREPAVPCTYRLPIGLHRRLDQAARHYGFSMTAFVQEAIETHLQHFPISEE